MSQSVKLSRHKMSVRHDKHHELESGNVRCQTKNNGFNNSSRQKNISTISLRSPALNRVESQSKPFAERNNLRTGSSIRSLVSVLSPVINRAKLFQEFHPGTESPICPTRSFSRNALKSPFLYRMKERAGSTSSQNKERYFGNFCKSHYEQDLDKFKEAHVKKFLSVNYEDLMPHFSGSELDTLSTCGQCGQSKVFGSPRRGWCTSGQHGELADILTDSTKDAKDDTNMSNALYVSHLETSDVMNNGQPHEQSTFIKFLCWKGDRKHQNTDSKMKSISIMFEYKRDINDFCIQFHDISSVMEAGYKTNSMYMKAYLLPGKKQSQRSGRIKRKIPGKDESFHFNLPFHKLSRYELIIKLYKRKSILSRSKSVAKTRISLHQYDFNDPAFIVWNLEHPF